MYLIGLTEHALQIIRISFLYIRIKKNEVKKKRTVFLNNLNLMKVVLIGGKNQKVLPIFVTKGYTEEVVSTLSRRNFW